MTAWLLLFAAAAQAAPIEIHKVGRLIDGRGNGARVLSQDGAYSIALSSGTLWVYGDTFFGSRAADGSPRIEGGVTNASAWSEDLDAGDGLLLRARAGRARRPAPVIGFDAAEDPEKARLWPGHGLAVGSRVYLYYSLVRLGPPGGFSHAGQGLAVAEGPLERFRRLKGAGGFRLWREHEPSFGMAVLRDRDGFVYVFGRSHHPPNGLFLARVRPESLESIPDYEYVCVRGGAVRWSLSLAEACPLFEDGPPEASVSWHPFIGQYLMVHSRFLDEDAVARLADRPWGPWSEPVRLYECPRESKPAQGVSCYAAKEHPQYARDGGRVIYFTVVDGRVFGGLPELFEAKLEGEAGGL